MPLTGLALAIWTVDAIMNLASPGDPQISPDGKWVIYAVSTISDPANNKSQSNLWLSALKGQKP